MCTFLSPFVAGTIYCCIYLQWHLNVFKMFRAHSTKPVENTNRIRIPLDQHWTSIRNAGGCRTRSASRTRKAPLNCHKICETEEPATPKGHREPMLRWRNASWRYVMCLAKARKWAKMDARAKARKKESKSPPGSGESGASPGWHIRCGLVGNIPNPRRVADRQTTMAGGIRQQWQQMQSIRIDGT